MAIFLSATTTSSSTSSLTLALRQLGNHTLLNVRAEFGANGGATAFSEPALEGLAGARVVRARTNSIEPVVRMIELRLWRPNVCGRAM